MADTRIVPVAALAELPPANGRTGWPWTDPPEPLPQRAPDGSAWPRISVVTPSFNQGGYIEQTIRSVLLQGYPNLEYVIIDGGSTDQSVEIIHRYEPWLSYWASEQDRGQSHAINKGLAHCTGAVFNWLCSDDLWCPGTAKAVAQAWLSAPHTVIAGPVEDFDDTGFTRMRTPQNIRLEAFVQPCATGERRLVWHQPGTFLPLAAVRALGGVREDLHYAMDHMLMIALLQRCRVSVIGERLARFRLQADSKTVARGCELTLEKIEALRALPDRPAAVSAATLRHAHANALLSCCEKALRSQRWRAACGYVGKALCVSPDATARRLAGALSRRFAARRRRQPLEP